MMNQLSVAVLAGFFSASVLANVSGLPDVTGDGAADVAIDDATQANVVRVHSGKDGAPVAQLSFFAPGWQMIDHATVRTDGGTTAIAALGAADNDGRIRVELKEPSGGAAVGSDMEFLNARWTAKAIGYLDDPNSDGDLTDSAVLVLATKANNGKHVVEARRVIDGERVGKWRFFGPQWDVKAVEGYTLADGSARIAVLGTSAKSGKSRIQTLNLTVGEKQTRNVAHEAVIVSDMVVSVDYDANGVADDPAVLLLRKKAGGNNVIRAHNALTGKKLDDMHLINAGWTADSVALLPDSTGNRYAELATHAANTTMSLVKVRDLSTGKRVSQFAIPTDGGDI